MATTIINIAIQRLQRHGHCTGDDTRRGYDSSSVSEHQVFWVMVPAVWLQKQRKVAPPTGKELSMDYSLLPSSRTSGSGWDARQLACWKSTGQRRARPFFSGHTGSPGGPLLGDVLLHYRDALVLQESGDAECPSAGWARLGAEVRWNQCREG